MSSLTFQNIDQVNKDFYNSSGNTFDEIPFSPLLPDLLSKYGVGKEILEIGSGPGALAVWLREKGACVICLEPAETLAAKVASRGIPVHALTLQQFQTDHKYDCVIAISSLIHVSKAEMASQIEKIAGLLKSQGLFFVNWIEGVGERFEDPLQKGKMRFFSKWTEGELDVLMSSHFNLLEKHRIYNEIMDRTFLLRVYRVKIS